jgi:hypothetical protein
MASLIFLLLLLLFSTVVSYGAKTPDSSLKASTPGRYYTYHLLQRTKTLHSAHRAYLCAFYGSRNKQRLSSQTALTY